MVTPSWSSGSANISAVGSPPTYDEPVAQLGVGAGHLLDRADAVLEADEVGVALAGLLEGVGAEHGVGARVVDSNTGLVSGDIDVVSRRSHSSVSGPPVTGSATPYASRRKRPNWRTLGKPPYSAAYARKASS